MVNKQNISPIERETIISYNEAEKTANVYTMNQALKNKLSKMSNDFPDLVKFKKEHPDGAVEYELPKKYIKVARPIVLTDEQIEKRVQALKVAKAARKN